VQVDLDEISDAAKASNAGENKMSNSYAVVSALIFAIVAIVQLVRIINRWTVVIGPYTVSMNVSWEALVVAVVLAIWGFMQIG
jgi:hypothetical protein